MALPKATSAEGASTDSLETIEALAEGGFAIRVNLASNHILEPWIVSNYGPWIVSSDGGATWTRSEGSPRGSSNDGPDPLQCAEDDICYLAHDRSREGMPVHVVERLDLNHTWSSEVTFGDECAADHLEVDAKDSTRAIVECGGTTIAYRAAGGAWRLVDVGPAAR